MMTFRWSWIFIPYSLLVRPGSAARTDSHIVNDILPRVRRNESVFSAVWLSTPQEPSSRPNVGAIVAGVFGGVGLIVALVVWFFIFRRRKSISHVEEGLEPKERPDGWLPDLKSEFSPDEKNGLRFDRIRDAFSRRGARKSQQTILPVYQVSLPPGSTDRPVLPAPAHIPRYPSMLERSFSKRPRPPPPPLKTPNELSRMPSMTDSLRSAQSGDRSSRRKVQIPPKVLLVPSPGRPLPGFPERRLSRTTPRSPSARKSWLSKRPFKHPFIPLRTPDPFIQFAPGSPLHPDRYHPSRELLETRFDSRSPKDQSRRELVRRQPVPLYEEKNGSTKQARLVEALHSAGVRTPVPLGSSKHPPDSAKPSYI